MDGFSSIRVSGGFELLSLQRTISVPVDRLKLDYIRAFAPVQRDLERDLSSFYAEVDWMTSSEDALSLRCSDPNRDVLNWQKDVYGCVEQFTGAISVKTTPLRTMGFSQIKQKLAVPNKVLVRQGVDAHSLYLTGTLEDVENAISKIEQWEAKDLTMSKQKEISLTKCEMFLLSSDLETEINERVPCIKVSIDTSKNRIILQGDEETLQSACLVVSNERFLIKERQITNLSPERRFLVGLENTKQYFCRKLKTSRVPCYVDTSEDYLKLSAFTDNALNKAETLLDTTIKEKYVDIQGDFEGSISPTEFTPLFRQIESKFPGLAKVEFVPIQSAVRIVSIVDHVDTILIEVERILSRSQVFEIVELYRPCILRYIIKTKADEVKTLAKRCNVQVLANTTLFALKMTGKDDALTNFRKDVEILFQTVRCMKLNLSLPMGFEERLPDVCSTLESTTTCAVDVRNMCHFDGVENTGRKVIVMTGSLKDVETDVLVVYTNVNHRPASKQSKSVIQMGGTPLVKEYKEWLKSSSLTSETGEWRVAVTGPGSLRNCLAVYHVILPATSSQVSIESLKQVYQRCFNLMEKQRFRSLAISRMEDVSERCHVQAFCGFLKEYFSVHNDSGIRTVVFCDEEQAANYLLYELMASKLSWNCQLQSLLPNNIVSCSFRPGYDWKKTPMIQTSLSFNFDLGSFKVQGLLGDLTDLKVDAIVNSSNKQLDLSKGAVSQNILIKGGSMLEKQLQTSEIRRGMAKHGLTVTCVHDNLAIPCQFIFHIDARSVAKSRHVTKAWKRLVVKCLKKAEEMKLSSLAFPALRTGSLQGDLECTAQFTLEGIEDFLTRRPSHLTQVYIVVLEQSVLEGLHDALRDRYIAKQRLWNPTYEPKVMGEILICGESEEILDKAARDIKRDVYGIYK